MRVRKKFVAYLREAASKKQRSFLEQGCLSTYNLYRKGKQRFVQEEMVSRLILQGRHLKRKLQGEKWHFVTIEDLVLWSQEWARTFPVNYDLIVGVPRSGLLVANLIALKLGKPLATPEMFSKDKSYWLSEWMSRRDIKDILLVDDSVYKGDAMRASYEYLKSLNGNFNIHKGAVIVHPQAVEEVDFYHKVLPNPRLFEWNILHSKKGVYGLDLDGVLCENCPPGVDKDEAKYLHWIESARPFLVPAFEIDYIVSNRLERYRKQTKEWLSRQGVKYKHLLLWDLPSKQERNGQYAENKIRVVLKIKPDMFWESSEGQARKIFKATKVPTLCIDEMILYS